MGDFFSRINHYGVDKETFYECRQLISKANRNNARIINLWFVLVNTFYYLCARFGFFNVDSSRKMFYLLFMVIAIVLLGMALFGIKKSPFFGTLCPILGLVMFEVYSIFSSNAEPYATCWIFLILMVIVALSYILTVGSMTLILLLFSIVFCRMSYLNKPRAIASMDLANTVVVASLAIVLHFAFQRARVNEFVTTIREIKVQRMLQISSSFDALSSLLNRGKFFSMLERTIKEKQKDKPVALLLMDLDGFKQINDKLGHQTGDLAIQLAAKAIMEALHIDLSDQWDFPERVLREKTSYAGRLGGDEFVVLLQGFSGRDEMMRMAESILDTLHHIEEGDIHGLRSSIGITMITDDDRMTDDIYKRADDALYAAKENGRNQISVNRF